jgi:hypothetical protein
MSSDLQNGQNGHLNGFSAGDDCASGSVRDLVDRESCGTDTCDRVELLHGVSIIVCEEACLLVVRSNVHPKGVLTRRR